VDRKIKYVIVDGRESLLLSITSDISTLVFTAFCVYISQDSTFWTLVTGCMFLAVASVKLKRLLGDRASPELHTKKDLEEWVSNFPD